MSWPRLLDPKADPTDRPAWVVWRTLVGLVFIAFGAYVLRKGDWLGYGLLAVGSPSIAYVAYGFLRFKEQH